MMIVELRLFQTIRMHRVSSPDWEEILSIHNYASLLHDTEWSISTLNLNVPYKLLLKTLKNRCYIIQGYIFKGFHGCFAFLSIQFAISILIKLFGYYIVLPSDIAVSIEVVTNVRDTFSMALFSKFCPCLFEFICDPWA